MLTIRELLPEVEQIKDKDLQEKVIKVWEAACKLNNWEVEDLLKIPFTLLIPDLKWNLIDHTRAVTQTSIQAAKVLIDYYKGDVPLDMDILIAGGLLHDVGKLLEYIKKDGKYVKGTVGKLLRHPFSGCALAYKLGLPEKVVHCIAVHAHEGDGKPRCPEAVIIHHSDFINFESLRDKDKF